jgi:hypothetical protein
MIERLLFLFLAGVGLGSVIMLVMLLAHIWYEEIHNGGWDE